MKTLFAARPSRAAEHEKTKGQHRRDHTGNQDAQYRNNAALHDRRRPVRRDLPNAGTRMRRTRLSPKAATEGDAQNYSGACPNDGQPGWLAARKNDSTHTANPISSALRGLNALPYVAAKGRRLGMFRLPTREEVT